MGVPYSFYFSEMLLNLVNYFGNLRLLYYSNWLLFYFNTQRAVEYVYN